MNFSNVSQERLQQAIDANPELAQKMIKRWSAMGVPVDGLETPWSVGGEIGSFLGGAVEGASYGLIDPEWGADSYKMPEETTIVGGESPANLLGNVLGGAVTGGLLFRQGAMHLGKPAMQKVIDKMGYSRGSKALGRGAFYAGAAVPETVVASTFETLRSGNIEDFGSNLAMWQGVGMLATPAGRKLSKMWFRRNQAKKAGNEQAQAAIEKEIVDTAATAEEEATEQARSVVIRNAEGSPNQDEVITETILDPDKTLGKLSQQINYLQSRIQSKRIAHDEKRFLAERLFELQKQEDEIRAALNRPMRGDDRRHGLSPLMPQQPSQSADVYASVPDPEDPLRTKDLSTVIKGRVFQPMFDDTVPLEAYEEDIIRSVARGTPDPKPAEGFTSPTITFRRDKTDLTSEEASDEVLNIERELSHRRDKGEVGPDPDDDLRALAEDRHAQWRMKDDDVSIDPRDPKTFGRMQREADQDDWRTEVEDKYDDVEDSGWVEGVDDVEPDPRNFGNVVDEPPEELVDTQKKLLNQTDSPEVKTFRRERELEEENVHKIDETLVEERGKAELLSTYRNRHIITAPPKQKGLVVVGQGQSGLFVKSDAISKWWDKSNINPFTKGPKLTRNAFGDIKANYERFLMQRAIEMRFMPRARFETLRKMDPPVGAKADVKGKVIEIEAKFWRGKTYEDYITQKALDRYEKVGFVKEFDATGKGAYTGELTDLGGVRAVTDPNKPVKWQIWYRDRNTPDDNWYETLEDGVNAAEAQSIFEGRWQKRGETLPEIRDIEAVDRDFVDPDLAKAVAGNWKGAQSARRKFLTPEQAKKLSDSRERNRTSDRFGEIAPDESHQFVNPKAFQTAIDGINNFRKRYIKSLRTIGQVKELGNKQKKEQLKLLLDRINSTASLTELQNLMQPEELKNFTGKSWGDVESALKRRYKALILEMDPIAVRHKAKEAEVRKKARGNQWWSDSRKGDQITLTPRRIVRGTEEVQQPGTTTYPTGEVVEGVAGTQGTATRGQAVKGVIEAIDNQKVVIDGTSYRKDTYYVSHNNRIKAERGARGGAPTEGELNPHTDEQFSEILRLVDNIRDMRIAGIDINIASIIPENLTARQANDLIARLSEARDLGIANKLTGITTELDVARTEIGLMQGLREGYRPPIEIQAHIDNLPLTDKERSATIIYGLLDGKMGLGSPHGRMLGMGRNPITHFGTKFNMRKIEEKQAMLARWQESYRSIRQLLGVPTGVGPSLQAGAQSLVGRVKGQVTDADTMRTKLYKLARALHEDNLSEESIEFLSQDPGHKQALDTYRVLMNEVADAIGLSHNRRIKHYLHILYSNDSGRPRFDMVASRLTKEEREALQNYIGMTDADDIDTQDLLGESVRQILGGPDQWRLTGKGFSALHRRTSEEATYLEHNLDLITDSYLHGAAEFWFTKEVGDTNSYILRELMAVENQALAGGRKLPNAKKHWADYLTHLYGEPSNSRKEFATILSNSALFNNAVDHLVGFVGAGEGSDFVDAMRRIRANPSDNDPAFDILNQWEELSRSRNPMTGEAEFHLHERSVETIRTRSALAIHRMREALADPTRSAPVANSLYRVQVMAKLGLNWAHAMINTLQNYTNLWPLVESNHMADGFMDYIHFYRNPEKMVHGKTVAELLEGSGVLDDASRYTEFTELRPGMFMENVQRVLMTPSSETEKFNRGVAYLSGYRKFRVEGVGHDLAHTKALDLVQDVHHPFNRAGTPPIMRGPMMRLFMMFKSYPIHQIEFTGGLAMDLKQDIADKGMRQALKDGDHTALTKHAFAYATLYGAALTAFSGSNFYERVKHPLHEQTSEWRENAPRYGPMSGVPKLLGGPFVDTMNDFGMAMANLAAFQSEEAIEMAKNGVENFAIPAFVRRVYSGETNPQTLAGFAEYKRNRTPSSGGIQAISAMGGV